MPVLGLHHAQVFWPAGGEATARGFLWVESDLQLHPRRHFALRVDDLARMRAALRGHGVRFEEAVEITGWKRCYVFDPFGNKIEPDQLE